MVSKELKKDDETKYKKQRGTSMELQGEFKKLIPLMFDGESGEAMEAWLLIIK